MTEIQTDQSPEYLSVVDTAKLVRKALKRAFPLTKFSVRSDSYSMGAAIDVGWTDGPTAAQVEAITNPFRGAGFDGMIDLKTYNTSWLEDDGTATLAHDRGTAESRGSMPERIGSRRTPGARLVHFGADYIHTNRSFTAEFLARRALTAHPCSSSHGSQCQVCMARVEEGFVTHDRFTCSRECAAKIAARYVAAVR